MDLFIKDTAVHLETVGKPTVEKRALVYNVNIRLDGTAGVNRTQALQGVDAVFWRGEG